MLLKAAVPNVPANTWAPTGDMRSVRAGAASALLYDGRVLVTGGLDTTGAARATVERYSLKKVSAFPSAQKLPGPSNGNRSGPVGATVGCNDRRADRSTPPAQRSGSRRLVQSRWRRDRREPAGVRWHTRIDMGGQARQIFL